MISGILAGGIPGFRIELCCFLQSPPAFMDLFTHKLVLVTSPLFDVGGFWLFVSGFVCLFVCFLVFCRVFLMSVTVHRTMYRSSTSLRPLQQWPLRDLINLLILIATCSQTC